MSDEKHAQSPVSSDMTTSKSPTPSKKENGLMKPPQSTEKAQRKRKGLYLRS